MRSSATGRRDRRGASDRGPVDAPVSPLVTSLGETLDRLGTGVRGAGSSTERSTSDGRRLHCHRDDPGFPPGHEFSLTCALGVLFVLDATAGVLTA
jgi:hypothetical protein